MNIPTAMPFLKGFRYPREIIAYTVWAYHRLALSTVDVEDLLAAWGVIGLVAVWFRSFESNDALKEMDNGKRT